MRGGGAGPGLGLEAERRGARAYQTGLDIHTAVWPPGERYARDGTSARWDGATRLQTQWNTTQSVSPSSRRFDEEVGFTLRGAAGGSGLTLDIYVTFNIRFRRQRIQTLCFVCVSTSGFSGSVSPCL
ncbi:unnamed protein product [Arctogadus glacialis]